MDDLIEFVLELLDGLTGHNLDYGIGRLAGRLTRNIRNKKAKDIVCALIWFLIILLVAAVLLAISFLIEANKMGKIG